MWTAWTNILEVIDESERVPKTDEAKNDTVSYDPNTQNCYMKVVFI